VLVRLGFSHFANLHVIIPWLTLEMAPHTTDQFLLLTSDLETVVLAIQGQNGGGALDEVGHILRIRWITDAIGFGGLGCFGFSKNGLVEVLDVFDHAILHEFMKRFTHILVKRVVSNESFDH
jgi:hypothetical protein